MAHTEKDAGVNGQGCLWPEAIGHLPTQALPGYPKHEGTSYPTHAIHPGWSSPHRWTQCSPWIDPHYKPEEMKETIIHDQTTTTTNQINKPKTTHRSCGR